MSYGAFAKYYDELMRDVDYSRRAKDIYEYILKYGNKGNGTLLDLACGTGSFSIEFAKLGFDVIGVDISYEMLSMALEKKTQPNLPVQFIRQDMRKLNMFSDVDVTICMLDSLNHLSSANDIQQVFKRVSKFSKTGGIFIFDVNTQYKHRCVLADNAYVFETPDVFCAWQNNFYSENCEVNIKLDFFEKSGKIYRRHSESFSEFAYSDEEISQMLEKSDFSVLETVDFETGKNPSKTSQKVIYICRKA